MKCYSTEEAPICVYQSSSYSKYILENKVCSLNQTTKGDERLNCREQTMAKSEQAVTRLATKSSKANKGWPVTATCHESCYDILCYESCNGDL